MPWHCALRQQCNQIPLSLDLARCMQEWGGRKRRQLDDGANSWVRLWRWDLASEDRDRLEDALCWPPPVPAWADAIRSPRRRGQAKLVTQRNAGHRCTQIDAPVCNPGDGQVRQPEPPHGGLRPPPRLPCLGTRIERWGPSGIDWRPPAAQLIPGASLPKGGPIYRCAQRGSEKWTSTDDTLRQNRMPRVIAYLDVQWHAAVLLCPYTISIDVSAHVQSVTSSEHAARHGIFMHACHGFHHVLLLSHIIHYMLHVVYIVIVLLIYISVDIANDCALHHSRQKSQNPAAIVTSRLPAACWQGRQKDSSAHLTRIQRQSKPINRAYLC